MITRKALYKVDIDFDYASEQWNKNKKRCGNGTYKYICGAPTKRNTPCQKTWVNGTNKCYLHKTTE